MTDHLTSLLHAVLARPEDDLPRLVYADALEEAGERERARYIRLSISLHNDPAPSWSNRDLEFRELRHGLNLGIPPEIDGVVRRGFVSSVRCSISAWCGEECRICRGRTMVAVPHDSFNSTFRTYERCIACHGTGRTPGHGPDIVARHPVELVEFTTLEPVASRPDRGAVWYWIAGALPAGLIPHMNQSVRNNPDAYALGSHAAFPSREAALVALSDAAIRWARAEAVRRELVPDVWGASRK